ncbi:MAG: hypothetical protein JKY26_01705 [Pseudomonas sp.]|uniref:hypothetical protein n=1 Tax=Halopseudomonas sp. TaxID=2901191 RepID=UPI001A370B6B|nr:hypothetical protein [Pseudomonas sp.]|tara:strand:+ start:1551 stop:1985 length:435 start_codon:yes stop_codon:yes gene_type:complete
MSIIRKVFGSRGNTEEPSARSIKGTTKPQYRLPFRIEFIDDGPEQLQNLLPINAVIIDKMQSPDGGEYYLAELQKPIPSQGRKITYLVVGGRLVGGGISPSMKGLPINIALVTNNELIKDEIMDFDKAEFAAIGSATAAHHKQA